MAKNFLLDKVRCDEKWNKYFGPSNPCSSIFFHSNFLRYLDIKTERYFILSGEEVFAGLLLCLSDCETKIIEHDLLVYSGLVFPTSQPNQNKSQKNSVQHEIASFVANKLPAMFDSVSITLSPYVKDIRPFTWFNYAKKEPTYEVNVRYTCFLDITELSGAKDVLLTECYRNMSKTRRQMIRNANKSGCVTRVVNEYENFINIYDKMFKIKSIAVPTEKLELMRDLIQKLMTDGAGVLLETRTSDSRISNSAFFSFEGKKATYLFGASDSEVANESDGTSTIWYALNYLAKSGVELVDLEGINSPKRGWFKMSFGAELKPYYEIKFQK